MIDGIEYDCTEKENEILVQQEKEHELERIKIARKSMIISMRQARLELLNRGLLDAVDSQIASMSQAAKIEWEYATEVKRDNPLVIQLQSSLSMSDADMDLFFLSASNL